MSQASQTPIPGESKLLSGLFQLLEPHLATLDTFLLQQVSSFEEEIRDYVAYCIDTGGKRIRPSLIFFSGWQGEGVVDQKLVKLAAVIETIHLATLVHDDIMDEADIRRSRLTVAKKRRKRHGCALGRCSFFARRIPIHPISNFGGEQEGGHRHAQRLHGGNPPNDAKRRPRY